MICINEKQEVFTSINDEIHSKSAFLIDSLKELGAQFTSLTTTDLNKQGIQVDHLYYIVEGGISLDNNDKALFIYEKGDIIIRSSAENDETGLFYTFKTEIILECISFADLSIVISKNSQLITLLFSISSLANLQLKQMIGVLTKKEERANPGFGRYKAGMTIINEGDEADYVYSISEGSAVAVHNNVEVGEIHKDEIFGAIAVITKQKRTASVVAKTDCTILMVHKDEFSKMLHSHPKLFMNILNSLADKITFLNAKVSSVS
jgi:CRP/FNR family cyclic AMP-dependent transcriptional regulator